MQYMVLIYDDERRWVDAPEAVVRQTLAAYGAYAERLAQAGVLRGGSELAPTTSATTLRVRGGKVLATDGPFAETREQLGGYYLIEAKDLDEAVKIAARIPDAKIANGCIEIRPVMNFSA